MLSMIELSLEGLVELVIYLMVIGGVCWLLLWLIAYLKVPEPFNKVAKAIVVVFGVLVLISLLLSFVGHPIFIWNR